MRPIPSRRSTAALLLRAVARSRSRPSSNPPAESGRSSRAGAGSSDRLSLAHEDGFGRADFHAGRVAAAQVADHGIPRQGRAVERDASVALHHHAGRADFDTLVASGALLHDQLDRAGLLVPPQRAGRTHLNALLAQHAELNLVLAEAERVNVEESKVIAEFALLVRADARSHAQIAARAFGH